MGHVDFKRPSFAAASAAGGPLDPVEAEPLARASGSIGSIAKAEARPSARPEISNLIAAITADRARARRGTGGEIGTMPLVESIFRR
jgi:hypothetical protein